jgi:predicted Rossmann fold nucleotide-binding protein DprA/Smf involved in DNA uptake
MISDHTHALLLLCGHFGKTDASPLQPRQYNQLARWLHANEMRPADLLTPSGEEALVRDDVLGESDRLRKLLQRGVALGMALDEWGREGIWVVGRGDHKYPKALQKKLRDNAPPLLFGVGPHELLEQKGIGMVGSRDADSESLSFTRRLAGRCVDEEWTVISGGAKGVDQEAMFGALEQGGACVGVLAEGVSRIASSKLYRRHIADSKLVLISTLTPRARWLKGNAMGRNKYIYALSEAVVVVSSGATGGTWEGAVEALKHKWVPVWVRTGPGAPAGNEKLVANGALPFDPDRVAGTDSVTDTLAAGRSPAATSEPTLFDGPSTPASNQTKVSLMGESLSLSLNEAAESQKNRESLDAYEVVWPLLKHSLTIAKTVEEVAADLGLELAQARVWVDRAANERRVHKVDDTDSWTLAPETSKS